MFLQIQILRKTEIQNTQSRQDLNGKFPPPPGFECKSHEMVYSLPKVRRRVFEKAFSSEYDSGDHGTIIMGGLKFLSGPKRLKLAMVHLGARANFN